MKIVQKKTCKAVEQFYFGNLEITECKRLFCICILNTRAIKARLPMHWLGIMFPPKYFVNHYTAYGCS